MNTLHVKKGDTVTVLSGNDKGKTGKVIAVFPKQDLVLVEGVNTHKRHQRSRRQGGQGQIVDKQMPIHISNISAKK